MTITIGWWAIPAIITIAALAVAFWPSKPSSYGEAVGEALLVLICVIISLAAWLVWSLLA